MASCETCGNQLGPEQSCSACLLELGVSAPGPTIEESLHGGESENELGEIRTQFSQLEITRLIGRGGMGAIYQARQTHLERDVALKVIAREIAGDSTFVDRFEREAKVLARLSHPNIVTVYDFGHTSDGQVYLVMEYIDGINLRQAMQQGPLPVGEAIETVQSIGRALDYAHQRGVVHRDIKPENILLGEDGTLKVADFGIAKIIDESIRTPTLTATRQVLGSLHYLAPEHMENPQQVDHRVDLYALGVILYELLTAELPLGRFETPRALRPELSPELDAMVMRLLSRKPANRYQSAQDFLNELEVIAAVGPEDSASDEESVASSVSSRASSHSVPFTCDAIAGLAEAVGTIYTKADASQKLVIEFRIRDALWGSLKSQTQTVEIPLEKLTRAKLSKGIFGCKLTLSAETISALGNLPNAETGSVELKIKRSDIELAEQLLAAIGHADRKTNAGGMANKFGISTPSLSAQPADRATSWSTLSLLLILCGIINFGFLYILEYVAFETLDSISLVVVAVTYAVLFAPVACIQLCIGLYTLYQRQKSLASTASVVSMLPIAPAWPISFPVGLWGYLWLRKEPVRALNSASGVSSAVAGSSVSQDEQGKSWGATTVLFLRESRWGRFVTVVNGIALLIVVAGLFAFRLGYYPTTMTLRVVNSEVDDKQIAKAIEDRLSDLSDIRFNYGQNRSRIQLSLRKYQQQPVEQRLAIEGPLEFVWLLRTPEASLKEELGSDSNAFTDYDVADGLKLPADFEISTPMGSVVQARSDAIALSADNFAAVTTMESDDGGSFGVEFELTSKGRQALESSSSASNGAQVDQANTMVLGILDDDLLIGISKPEQRRGRVIEFDVTRQHAVSAAAIIAAARGPVIPSQLEVIR